MPGTPRAGPPLRESRRSSEGVWLGRGVCMLNITTSFHVISFVYDCLEDPTGPFVSVWTSLCSDLRRASLSFSFQSSQSDSFFPTSNSSQRFCFACLARSSHGCLVPEQQTVEDSAHQNQFLALLPFTSQIQTYPDNSCNQLHIITQFTHN